MQGFNTSADYYEVLTNSAARLEREGPFLRECLERAPGTRFADLACGTGLHALFFAEQGATVDAFDLSPEMIQHAARLRPHEAINYAVGDMRYPEGGPWDLAVCLGNSLSLLATESDLEAVFSNTRARLNPGGLFVVQILNYQLPKAAEPRHRIERAQAGAANIVAVKSLVPHAGRTLLTLNFFAEEGDDIRSVSQTAVLRNWTPDDLTRAAKAAGFQPERLCGGFDGTDYEPETSSDLVVILKR